jgi:Cu-Zn family superoxide dismutase
MRQRLLALLVAAPLALGAAGALAQSAPPAPAAPAAQTTPPPAPFARAALKTPDGGDAGTVTAVQGPQGVLFRVEGQGWPAGWHGVHLHAVGKCEGPGFTSAGAHVNHPGHAMPHGLLNPAGPDLGDLQNIHAAADGSALAEVYIVNPDGRGFLDGDGLSFLVHANADDHISQPIGGAGPRIACGVFEPIG